MPLGTTRTISSRLPKDAGGNIVPTRPPSSGRRTPVMTRRPSTFPAGQPADPDELQVEFERRVAWLLIASSANFIPISAAWFVCDWSLFARAGSRIVAVRNRINHPYEHTLSESPRKPTQTATTRQARQASQRQGSAARATVHLDAQLFSKIGIRRVCPLVPSRP